MVSARAISRCWRRRARAASFYAFMRARALNHASRERRLGLRAQYAPGARYFYFFIESTVTGGVCGRSAFVAIHNTSASSSLVDTAAWPVRLSK